MTGAFPCATIQQPKEKWDQRCISVFLSSKVSQYHKGDWHGKNEWSWKAKGGKRTMHLVKCEWLQLGEPAADLQCALPRNWASQNWNDSMLDDSSRLKSRQCECHLLCPLAIFFINIYTYTDTHTGVLIHTHIRTHTHIHTLGASAALPQCPFLAKHLVQTRKALTDFSKILQALPKVWLPKTHSYSSSSSSSSGSGSNSSFRHSL